MKKQYKRDHSQSQEKDRHKHKHKSHHSDRIKKYQHSSSDQRDRKNKHSNKQKISHQIHQSYRNDEYQSKNRNQPLPPKNNQIIKEKPCWQPSGILLKYYNARDGISLKFHQPPQSRTPLDIWKIYIFKGDEVLNPISLNNSCYLIGKDDRVADILCQNPSISRQHAVIQFRLIIQSLEDGTYIQVIKPYIMDLQSTNGTFLNDTKIQHSRYIELLHKDVLRFGFSERQYVMVKDQTAQIHKNQEDYD